jgi:hypothetical protein
VAHNDLTRISSTLLKSVDGFRAALDGLDLPTLIQMLCARRVRTVLRIASGEQEGFLWFAEGQLVHAASPGREGESAFAAMLAWSGGETSAVERPFPLEPTLHGSIEALLLRAAQAHDERGRRDETGVTRTQSSRRFEVVPGDGGRAPAEPPARESAVRAAVRVSPNGELLSAEGDTAMFAELVSYLVRLGVVLGGELALEPVESLHAELGSERLVVFTDGADTVGLLLRAGAMAQELRKQLGH